MINLFMFIPLLIMFFAFGLYIWQAVWVAVDSRKKGEEYWWLWTIVALMTFPVGVIVYALVTRSNVSRCNNCGKEVPSNINSCPYCGEVCGQICSNCGQKVQSGWKYCPSCTTELPENIAFASKPKRDNRILFIIIAFIVGIFLLIAGLFVAFSVNVFEHTKIITEEATYGNVENFFSQNTFDEPYTGTRSYSVYDAELHELIFKGERKRGYVVVRIYDSNNNILEETKKLRSKDISGTIKNDSLYGISKIEIDFNKYEGTFYLDK